MNYIKGNDKKNKEHISIYNNPIDCIHKTNIIAILTEWDEFKDYNWKKIFDEVKIEHSNDKLIFENDLIEIQNKPVQFLDNFIFKQLGKKLLVFNHKNCQQRILYEKEHKKKEL